MTTLRPILLLGLCLMLGCNKPTKTTVPPAVPVENWSFRFVKSTKHDRTDYTQGLIYRDGFLFESTGQYRESKLRKVRIADGASLQKINLAHDLFGEGLTEFDGRLYQLTWKAGDCLVYDMASFEVVDHFRYAGEGWGLTHDGTHFIMSDGSHRLTYRDSKTFEKVKQVEIFQNGRWQSEINELEYVDGLIYANVYMSDDIMVIDPSKQAVVAKVDCKKWVERARRLYARSEVLNGIAHNPDTGHFYITGKDWPIMFEVALEKAP